jgi:ADP-heptose:LPS heptosyltransferase
VIDTQGLLKSALIARCASGPRHGMDRASGAPRPG